MHRFNANNHTDGCGGVPFPTDEFRQTWSVARVSVSKLRIFAIQVSVQEASVASLSHAWYHGGFGSVQKQE